MGTDVNSYSGVVIDLHEFLAGVICGRSKSAVVDVCLDFYATTAADAENDAGSQWKESLRKSFEPLSGLSKKMTLDEIREAVASCADIRGEAGKYGEMSIDNGEELFGLLEEILEVCPKADNLPPIDSISIWASARLSGWEVPLGVACVVIHDDEVFEKVLSPYGKAVKKLFGGCESLSWTEVSY